MHVPKSDMDQLGWNDAENLKQRRVISFLKHELNKVIIKFPSALLYSDWYTHE